MYVPSNLTSWLGDTLNAIPHTAWPGACEYDAMLSTTSVADDAPGSRLPLVAANTWMLSAQVAGSGTWIPGPGAASVRCVVDVVPAALTVTWIVEWVGLHATKLQLPVFAGSRPSTWTAAPMIVR